MQAFEGKCGIVTGGGTGIGRATAERLAAAGADVIICGRREVSLREVAESYPERIGYLAVDIGDEIDCRALIEAAIDRHGRLDMLVNNAAASVNSPFSVLSLDIMKVTLDVNLLAPMHLIHLELPHLIQSVGTVVNVSSAGARYQGMPPAGMSCYAASKAGLNQLTRVLATELGEHGIRVNAVSPGMTDTEMAADAMKEPAYVAGLEALIPLGRIGRPDDVARVIEFMLSEDAGWVTGQVVDATGGFWLSN